MLTWTKVLDGQMVQPTNIILRFMREGEMEPETDRPIHEARAVLWAGYGTFMLKRELSLKTTLSIYQWIQPRLVEITFIYNSFAKAHTF